MPGALVVVLVLGCVALLLGFSRWLAHRPWAALGNAAVGVALLATVIVLGPAARQLQDYERIPEHGPVAQLHCERTAPGRYRVTLTRLPRGRMEVYDLVGEQWRLDARTLVWKGAAGNLGLPPVYQFERLVARELSSPAPATAVSQSAKQMRLPEGYALTVGGDSATDFWSQARAGRLWRTGVEPGRSYGPWQPLADGARFEVRMRKESDTTVRLEARPQAIGYTAPRLGPARAHRN